MPRIVAYPNQKTYDILLEIHNEDAGEDHPFSSTITEILNLGIRVYQHNKNKEEVVEEVEFDIQKCLEQILGRVTISGYSAEIGMSPESRAKAKNEAVKVVNKYCK